MIYFVSDVHLGLNFGPVSVLDRERRFVEFLDKIEPNCEELFLLGDIIDFWFEWKRTVPRGYVRLLGKLASMCDRGMKIHFFTGNHDLWVDDYLQNEIGLIIHKEPYLTTRQGKQLFLAHGDTFYQHKGVSRLIEIVFRSQWARWIGQRIIHPDAMVRFGMKWSLSNRKKRGGVAHVFGAEEDYLVKYSRSYLVQNSDIDYFVFGHLHTPVDYPLNDRTHMIVLGEWVENPVYAALDNGVLSIHRAQ